MQCPVQWILSGNQPPHACYNPPLCDGELFGSVLVVIILGELEPTGRQAHPPIQAGFSLLAFAA